MQRGAVEARLLGEVRVLIDGADLAVGGPALRLLLTMLLMSVGQVVPRERLVEALWGEEPPDAESALRVNVTRLRKRLAPTGWTITNRGTGYQLDGVSNLDLERLDRLEEEVRAAADAEQRFSAVLAATALWDGPALGEFRQLEVGRRLAVRLDGRRLALRRTLFESAISVAHLQRCAAEFADWSASDPLDEIAACAHATALAATGRTTAALRHLTTTRAALADVGLGVSRALADLELRILTNAGPTPALPDQGSGDFPAGLVGLAERPLVGRSTDLAELHRAWRRAATTGTQVVRITGPSGVGKSALLAHFAGQLHEAGVAIAFGACDVDSARPLQVIAAIVQQLEPGFVLEAWTSAAGDDGPAARSTVVEQAAGDLVRVLDRRPTLVVIDDVRGIDELSLGVLRRMLALRPVYQAMVALTERDTARPRLADRRITTRSLSPLGSRALQHWIGRHTSWTTADLQALTGGLPLLVEEALARGRPDAPGGLTEVGISLFEDHVAGLTEDSLDTITTAALLGSTFAVEEVVALRHHREMEVVEHLDAAIRRGLLNDGAARQLSFRHELFRHAAVNRWSSFRTARTHAEVVLGTDIVARDPLRAIRHVEQAGDFVPRSVAMAVALGAGRLQMRAKAYGDARRALALGTARVDGSPQTAEEVAVLSLAGTCAAFEGDGAAAAELFDVALAGATALDDPALLVEVFVACATVTPSAAGRDSELFHRMFAVLGRIDGLPAIDQSAFLRQLVRLALNIGERVVLADLGQRMETLLPRLERPEDRVRHWMSTYAMVSSAGDPARRREAVGEVMQLVEGDPWVASGFAAVVSEHLRAGAVERADTFVASALASFTRAEDRPGQWLATAMQFTFEFLRGDVDAAEARSRAAHQLGVAVGIRAADDTRRAQRYFVRWVEGQLGRAADELRPVLGRPFSFPWRCALALSRATVGQFEEAAGVLDGCAEEVTARAGNFLGVVGIAEAAEAAWLCGHRRFAAAAGPVFAARRGDHVLLGSAVMDLGPATRYEALCRLTLDPANPAAIELLSVVADDPGSCPMWQLRAAVDLAAVGVRPAPDDSRWSWVLNRKVDTERLKFVDEG